MKKPARKRGRPREANAITAAERMRGYRQRKKAAELRNVRHPEPEAHPFEGRYSDHQILDARSLALHCAIARKITRDAAMLQIAKDNLERWAKRAGRHPPRQLASMEADIICCPVRTCREIGSSLLWLRYQRVPSISKAPTCSPISPPNSSADMLGSLKN